MKAIRLLQFWLFLLFCSYLSLTSAPPHALQAFSDKLLHASGYLVLYLSCSLAYPRAALTLYKLLFLLSSSIIIEVLQHFIPHRGFSLLDILANAGGLVLGLMLIRLFQDRFQLQS